MFNLNQLRYGKSEPLPRAIPLRAGPLSLLYEDGDLRAIRLGGQEIVRRIYAAVRDRNWATVPSQLAAVCLDVGDDGFLISYQVVNQQDDISFTWHGLLSGEADGTITFRMEGQALSTFMKNRIGLCLLHPVGLAGKPCTITQANASQHAVTFPEAITPDQPPLPFTDITKLSYTAGEAQVEIQFSGAVFEMEDQRNWSDASFKTYCPPLRCPYPNEIKAGTEVLQAITIRTRCAAPKNQSRKMGTPGITLEINPRWVGRLPSLGTGMASHGGELTVHEIERIKALHLSHLRADLRLDAPGYEKIFYQAVAQSHSLGLPLYLGLHVGDDGEYELRGFMELYQAYSPQVALWLVYPASELYLGGSPTARVVDWVRNSIFACLGKTPICLASGTDNDFIFFLRNLPPFDHLAAVCFAVNPQVHAFDNTSLMETLEAQQMMVINAQRLAGVRSVVVSPVTLRQRHNPYASGLIPTTPPDELPPQVDYRQPTLFTAAWLVGSLRALSLGGARAVTYFETTGWRGLMELDAGSPVPEKFFSFPGAVFPAYHILAEVGEYAAGSELLSVEGQQNLPVQGLAFRRGTQVRLIVANLTPAEQFVTIRSLPRRVLLRRLDETNAEAALCSPENYRAFSLEDCPTVKSRLSLDLLPYAVVTLNW